MRIQTSVNVIAHTLADEASWSRIGTCASSQDLANAIILEQFERGSPERHALLRKRWQGRQTHMGSRFGGMTMGQRDEQRGGKRRSIVRDMHRPTDNGGCNEPNDLELADVSPETSMKINQQPVWHDRCETMHVSHAGHGRD